MDSHLDEVRYNIKHYRKERRLSQAALAEKCDCALGTIGGIESGRAKPSFDMLEKIATALDVHPADLYIQDVSKSQEDIKQGLYAQFSSILNDASEHLRHIAAQSE